jgi:hypothetical protein
MIMFVKKLGWQSVRKYLAPAALLGLLLAATPAVAPAQAKPDSNVDAHAAALADDWAFDADRRASR